MTQLRKMMLEELERRNYAQSTTRAYLRTIEDLARYFKRPPDQLAPEHIREYQAYLFRERKLSPNTVNQRTGALRFFFIVVLKKPWSIAETPYPRRNFRLPKILSQEQVAKLIDSATTPFYRAILMTLYATGLRRAELADLKVSDVDSDETLDDPLAGGEADSASGDRRVVEALEGLEDSDCVFLWEALSRCH